MFAKKYQIIEKVEHRITLPSDPRDSDQDDVYRVQMDNSHLLKDIQLYRIQAIRDIPAHGVNAWDIGGWVSHKNILSQKDESWIADEAKVIRIPPFRSQLKVSGNALVKDNALVIVSSFSPLLIEDNARITGNSKIHISYSYSLTDDDSFIRGDAHIGDNSIILSGCKITGSVTGNCVLKESQILENAKISGDYNAMKLEMRNDTEVKGDGILFMGVTILDKAIVDGGVLHAGCTIKDNAKIHAGSRIGEKAVVGGNSVLGGGAKVKASTIVTDEVISAATREVPKPLSKASKKLLSPVPKNVPNIFSQKEAMALQSKIVATEEETDLSLSMKKLVSIKESMLSYESDIAKVLMYPTFVDNTDEKTLEMRIALTRTGNISPTKSPQKFIDAVDELERKFMIAEAHARRVASSGYTEDQRRQAETAKKLLALVVDDASSDTEKKGAFKQAFRKLEGIVAVPEVAVETLRQKSGLLELEV